LGSYELTERGKIVIAIILVLIFLVLPSTILAVRAWSGPPPPPDDSPGTAEPLPDPPDDESPDISEPLPNGSGFNPHDPPDEESHEEGNGNGASDDYDPPCELPEFGPVSLNITEGTMIFAFSPDLQDSLDDDTFLMLEKFLKSPRNLPDAQILVEMPSLSNDDTTILISAINDAFLDHGISLQDLVYLKTQEEPDERFFEVKLSFYIPPSQK